MVSRLGLPRHIRSKSFGTDGVFYRLLCPLSFDTAIRLNGELIVDTCQSGLEVYLMVSPRKLVCGDGEQPGIVFESVCRFHLYIIAVFQSVGSATQCESTDNGAIIFCQRRLHDEVISFDVYRWLTDESSIWLACRGLIITNNITGVVLPVGDDEIVGHVIMDRCEVSCVAFLAFAEREAGETAGSERTYDLLTGEEFAAMVTTLKVCPARRTHVFCGPEPVHQLGHQQPMSLHAHATGTYIRSQEERTVIGGLLSLCYTL